MATDKNVPADANEKAADKPTAQAAHSSPDQPEGTPVRLYSSEGAHLHNATIPVQGGGDPPQALRVRGRVFVWNIRNGQYREVDPVSVHVENEDEPAAIPPEPITQVAVPPSGSVTNIP